MYALVVTSAVKIQFLFPFGTEATWEWGSKELRVKPEFVFTPTLQNIETSERASERCNKEVGKIKNLEHILEPKLETGRGKGRREECETGNVTSQWLASGYAHK